jgi:hypothetical protein
MTYDLEDLIVAHTDARMDDGRVWIDLAIELRQVGAAAGQAACPRVKLSVPIPQDDDATIGDVRRRAISDAIAMLRLTASLLADEAAIAEARTRPARI